MKKPNFSDLAREWLVRAQGHARPEHEKSLAAEMERVWELGVANAIEVANGHETGDQAVDAMRDLVAKSGRFALP